MTNKLNKQQLTPFLKWPGGKRWFTTNHADLLPQDFDHYIEPFLGSAPVFFYLKPKEAVLGDTNPELINTYNIIKQDWAGLEGLLRNHQKEHREEYYYKIRDSEPNNPVERAARFIYLNRTCFNGIYRVNLQGKFNVPKGTKTSVLLDTDDFHKVSQLLASADIRVSDFEALINEAKSRDLVFADPPYTVRHNNNGFIKYNEKLFSWDDQLRLAKALTRARNRGVKIISTNANNRHIRDLYKNQGFQLKVVSRYSSISASAGSRKQFDELVIIAN